MIFLRGYIKDKVSMLDKHHVFPDKITGTLIPKNKSAPSKVSYQHIDLRYLATVITGRTSKLSI